MRLTDIRTVKEIMERHGVHFQKKFGQNFLINPLIPDRIAAECGAKEEDAILEIGPGIGTLTQYLADSYKKVVAVEIDDMLIEVLQETLADFDNVTVIHGDILKIDLPKLFQEQFAGMHVTVCANLPYYITTPIIMALLEAKLPIDNITIMIQKEVADRLASHPGKPDWGAISVVVSYYAHVEKLFPVSSGNFMPAPKVDSTVIRLEMYQTPPVQVISEAMLFRVIKAAFAQRRKTLMNSLGSSFGEFSKEKTAQMIAQLGFAPDVRGERLTLEDFARLADQISQNLEK